MYLEEDVAESGPPPKHIDIVFVFLKAREAGERVDELHVWQVALAREVVEERGVLHFEVLSSALIAAAQAAQAAQAAHGKQASATSHEL